MGNLDEPIEARLADAQRIVVVDDDEGIVALLRAFLANEGYECVGFTMAEDALAYVAGHRCDLVITDMVMPLSLSGLQMVEEMARRHPGMPVLVMSGYQIAEAVTRCLQSGAIDYLQKPFDFDRVRTVVRAVLLERTIRSDIGLRNRLISGYRVLRPLREDPLTPTFLAKKAKNPREQVALTIFRFADHTAEHRHRIEADFRRVCRLACTIKNPYVIEIQDFGLDAEGGIPYLVAAYEETTDLRT